MNKKRRFTILEIIIALILAGVCWAAVATQYPTGDGNKAGGTFTYTSGSTAWNLVDENPLDDTDYFQTPNNGSGGYHLFTFASPNIPNGSNITGVLVGLRIRDNASGANSMGACLLVNGSYYNGTMNNPGTTFTTYTFNWATNPNTTANWTAQDVNGVSSAPLTQFGVKGADWNPAFRVSWNYMNITYTPPDLPTVTTQSASSVLNTTATGNGNITATGGNNPSARGFVYGNTSYGDPGNVSPTSTSYASYAEDTGDFSTGTFTKALVSLIQNTIYYIRAYAKNSVGWFYGNEESFTTLDFPSVTTQALSDITSSAMTANGNITSLGNDADCDKRGAVYDTSTKALPGNVAPGSSGYAYFSESTGSYTTGAFTQGLTSLSSNTTYYSRVYTHNTIGYSYGSEVNATTSAAQTTPGYVLGSFFEGSSE